MRNYLSESDPGSNPHFRRCWTERPSANTRAEALALPTRSRAGNPNRDDAREATREEARKRFMKWLCTAAAEGSPQARLAAFDRGLADMRALGVVPADLLREAM